MGTNPGRPPKRPKGLGVHEQDVREDGAPGRGAEVPGADGPRARGRRPAPVPGEGSDGRGVLTRKGAQELLMFCAIMVVVGKHFTFLLSGKSPLSC